MTKQSVVDENGYFNVYSVSHAICLKSSNCIAISCVLYIQVMKNVFLASETPSISITKPNLVYWQRLESDMLNMSGN